MHLIVLYGPPASGKYTIGKGLAEKTGYFLFHNHLTIDFLKHFFARRTDDFVALDHEVTTAVLKKLSADHPGVVYTFVYDPLHDGGFVEELQRTREESGGKIDFVRVSCKEEVLLDRVNDDSRKPFNKVHRPEHLKRFLESGNYTERIDGVESIEIDSGALSVDESVAEIITKTIDEENQV